MSWLLNLAQLFFDYTLCIDNNGAFYLFLFILY